MTINLVDMEESFVLEPEDTFFLPAETKYQLVNFESNPVKVIFFNYKTVVTTLTGSLAVDIKILY